jgi:hypothetical protein
MWNCGAASQPLDLLIEQPQLFTPVSTASMFAAGSVKNPLHFHTKYFRRTITVYDPCTQRAALPSHRTQCLCSCQHNIDGADVMGRLNSSRELHEKQPNANILIETCNVFHK